MLPPLLEDTIDDAQCTLKRCTEDALRRDTETRKSHSETLELLNRVTVQMLTTGIAQIPAKHMGLGQHLTRRYERGMTWFQYLRDLAKEARRPLVYVVHPYRYDSGYCSVGMISIEKRVYTRPLVGPFMLALESGFNGLTKTQVHTRHVFSFTNETMPLVDHWLKSCATDPVMRKALRLDRPPAYLTR